MKRICIYAGSCFGASPAYGEVAAAFGDACARRGLDIVYGGGGVGLMGMLANSALAAGGKVIGVIPSKMAFEERAHRGLTQLITVETLQERKRKMAELADAFVALPGGIGTLDEITEMFTWLQLGLHLKPVGLLNARGFYDRFLDFLAHQRDEGFLTAAHYAMLTVAADPDSMLDRLQSAQHIPIEKPIQPVTR